MTKAMRQTNHSTAHVSRAFHLDFNGAHARHYAYRGAVLQTARDEVVGVHLQGMPWLALHQPWRIVHPRIVAAHMAPTDE
jgi:hypothetical protein